MSAQDPFRVPEPATAVYVLDRLLHEHRIAPRDIARYLADLPAEIADLERRLQRLRDANEEAPAPPRRSRRASKVAGKALGGTYGGLIRRVPAKEQSHYKEVKRTRGIEAAIAALRARATR
jgi:hypothetical protein